MMRLRWLRVMTRTGVLLLAVLSAAPLWAQGAGDDQNQLMERIQKLYSWWNPNKPIQTPDDFRRSLLAAKELGHIDGPQAGLAQAERALAWARSAPQAGNRGLSAALYVSGDLALGAKDYGKADKYLSEGLAVIDAAAPQDEYWKFTGYETLHLLLEVRLVSGQLGQSKELAGRLARTEAAPLRESVIRHLGAPDALDYSHFDGFRRAAREPYSHALDYLQNDLNIIVAGLLGDSDRQTLANAIVLRKAAIQDTFAGMRSLYGTYSDHAPKIPDALGSHATLAAYRKPDPGATVMERLRDNAAATSLVAYGNPNLSPVLLPPPLDLQHERTNLERDLAHQTKLPLAMPTLADITHAIPHGALVIEFVTYAALSSTPGEAAERRYLAMGLSSKGVVGLADIGAAKDIDALVAKACWSLVFDITPESAATRCLGDGSSGGEPPAPKDIGAQLYQVLLKPVAAVMGEYKTLIISPDDALNFLPFDILTDADGRYLLATHGISYVQSTREIVEWGHSVPSRGPPVIIADPDYDARPSAPQTPCPAQGQALQPAAQAGGYLVFSRLCGSGQEAERIRDVFPDAHVLTGRAATEEAVKGVWGPRILHFATHGFVLKELRWSPSWFPANHTTYWTMQDFDVLAEDPMFTTGLALTGANIRSSPGHYDDGLLSAQEASLLDLDGTQLVVLSACDSGLGVARAGEGVFGLRKAFALAGARAQTFALWPVPDATTTRFMEMYYALLASGLDNNLALAGVKLKFMAEGADPGIWAAFVGYGYPGALGP